MSPNRSPLRAGMKLEVVVPIRALSGYSYKKGAILELVEYTSEAPFGFRSPLGNWVVKCQYQTSVWSSIWISVDQGWLKIQE